MRKSSSLARSLLLLAAVAAGPARAQMPAPSTVDPKRATREQQSREASLRSAEVFTRRAPDSADARATAAEVRKDFARLQELRNEIAKPLVARAPLDLKAIVAKADEVNRRASRLKSRLLLYDAGTPAGAAATPAAEPVGEDRMQPSLVILCKTIDRFVASPVFETQGVVDVKASSEAGAELLRIIDLSDRIRRGAERARRGER